jgi:hypothetical protein
MMYFKGRELWSGRIFDNGVAGDAGTKENNWQLFPELGLQHCIRVENNELGLNTDTRGEMYGSILRVALKLKDMV